MDPIVITDIWGAAGDVYPPTRLPDGLVVTAQNIILARSSIGRRRNSLAAISLTSGPSAAISQLFRHQPGTDETGASGAELWAWSGTSTLHRRVNGTWSSVTPSDTVASWATSRPYAATFNGKLFLAYNSDVNRLHVWDGTSARRVGIEASAAPTVADTGSGSYAATIRYYKAQFKIKSGSNVIATSELSAEVSFTPSGSGTAARVTKPTTPDSATHWRVFGSADNVTFYELGSADIAVGTTTYDDSTAPSAYSSGTVAPTPGLSVPPPSAKYLLAADNRLFMAGCHETTATSTQTATRNSRVWFTAVLGARDNTGEDEAIVQTADLRHWIDCGENDGDAIIGLGGPLNGAVYVFKRRTVWRLTPTGNVNAPYRADQVTTSIGARTQDGIVMGEDASHHPALYFMSSAGPARITPGAGLTAYLTRRNFDAVAVWDPGTYTLWMLNAEDSGHLSIQPEFERASEQGILGGLVSHFFPMAIGSVAACLYEVSGVLSPVFGGAFASAAYLSSLTGETHTDAEAGSAFTPRITTGIYQPGGLLRRVSQGNPVLEWRAHSGATGVSHSVTIASVIEGPVAVTGTNTATTASTAYTNGAVVQEKLESLQLSDVLGLQATVTWDTTIATQTPQILSLTVPVVAQEPS